jgi:hypothetical protein
MRTQQALEGKYLCFRFYYTTTTTIIIIIITIVMDNISLNNAKSIVFSLQVFLLVYISKVFSLIRNVCDLYLHQEFQTEF